MGGILKAESRFLIRRLGTHVKSTLLSMYVAQVMQVYKAEKDTTSSDFFSRFSSG